MSNNFNFIMELDIQNLDEKILEFCRDADELSRRLIEEKYILKHKEINLRLIAKDFKTGSKKVAEAMENAENKLYRYLQKIVIGENGL